jgi:hypothetical protein
MFDRSMVLDGEMVSSSFLSWWNRCILKSDVQSDDVPLMLFDILLA